MGAELKPIIGFLGFFSSNFTFMNEVGAAFGLLRFPHVGAHRSAAAYQLASYNVAAMSL